LVRLRTPLDLVLLAEGPAAMNQPLKQKHTLRDPIDVESVWHQFSCRTVLLSGRDSRALPNRSVIRAKGDADPLNSNSPDMRHS
jgi:hypothetical protein